MQKSVYLIARARRWAYGGMRVYKHGVYCHDRHLDRLEDSAIAMAFEGSHRGISSRPFRPHSSQWHDWPYPYQVDLDLAKRLPPEWIRGWTAKVVRSLCWPNGSRQCTTMTKTSVSSLRPFVATARCTWTREFTIITRSITSRKDSSKSGEGEPALMLDNLGFIAEMNGTNIFIVKNQALDPQGGCLFAGLQGINCWNGARTRHIRGGAQPPPTDCIRRQALAGSMGELTLPTTRWTTPLSCSGTQITQELVKYSKAPTESGVRLLISCELKLSLRDETNIHEETHPLFICPFIGPNLCAEH